MFGLGIMFQAPQLAAEETDGTCDFLEDLKDGLAACVVNFVELSRKKPIVKMKSKKSMGSA